jgi:hypothetical protein
LLPDAEQWTNGGKSRGSSVAHPAGLRVEQTFERQLAGDQQLPLLAELSLTPKPWLGQQLLSQPGRDAAAIF